MLFSNYFEDLFRHVKSSPWLQPRGCHGLGLVQFGAKSTFYAISVGTGEFCTDRERFQPK